MTAMYDPRRVDQDAPTTDAECGADRLIAEYQQYGLSLDDATALYAFDPYRV